MKKPVIMDCDPGHDDAIALLLAFASDKLEVKAVTIVAGNQTQEKTLNNALRVLSFANIEAPVARGAEKPLMRELITAPEVHGDSGLDGPELPEATLKPVDLSAIELIAKVVRESDERITLIPTGALTNIAKFILCYPELKNKIERISLMGGACVGGNWSPAAEFNILVDPEAADIVFKSGIPITMCGLDVTHRALIYEEDIERIRSVGGKVAVMVAELLEFFAKFHMDTGFEGSPLHDPCAVAWVIDPTIINTKKLHVDIETTGIHTLGATVVDYHDVLKKEKNAEVAFDIDREKFVDMLVEAMKFYQ
ncbi:pyrimidine-specific ribonucleoside hydrolase [Anaerovirgula multivorans]|uniref:Pyrimidine-specific ribonucleoside hydrolase n=1 Tax=Anaerovirgula multivorans TaxID=312168 RepID=A0A239FB43_9FIRM|nr:pyrimidine-specific ribonucleoside hydrolase RihA [Anaerovirgula multivorans]SNS54136.1 pyrimidine-specific ribonucleoside hydrolase [Anaerovirgula multivorans]